MVGEIPAYQGSELSLAPNGFSVMETAHRFDVDIEGACEGSLACATCHVFVDDAWFQKLGEPSEDEEDMLG